MASSFKENPDWWKGRSRTVEGSLGEDFMKVSSEVRMTALKS